MALLEGKRALILGIASNRSIAWGIARAMHREGAELALTGQNERLCERVAKLAGEVDSNIVLACDVASDSDIDDTFGALRQRWDGLDIVVHAVAFAPREALQGNYLDSVTRESHAISHDVSAYSFAALAKAARPMMRGRDGALLALTYIGATRPIVNYNVMGPAKASLEANVRYVAAALGPEGIRANAISAGTDQDAGRGRNLGLPEHNSAMWRPHPRSGATSPSTMSAMSPRFCAPTSRPA